MNIPGEAFASPDFRFLKREKASGASFCFEKMKNKRR